ncbi:hypothetical protein B4098_0220 [Heyndrickxia coagulans]|uniref:Uncharacterized protein n=1 Tax=Heyndrickxia coagulans TaxID=1398 RepID=A0A150K6R0_HEYCO|nr:hypothetical protein B4098_0220 [Heyndrickxia coagulans]KYC69672.1 hypothetical protein B4099_0301 [Heyndrickxia coagulans]
MLQTYPETMRRLILIFPAGAAFKRNGHHTKNEIYFHSFAGAAFA